MRHYIADKNNISVPRLRGQIKGMFRIWMGE